MPHTGSGTHTYTLPGLEVFTHYYISVAAATTIGLGPYANTSVMTLKTGRIKVVHLLQ